MARSWNISSHSKALPHHNTKEKPMLKFAGTSNPKCTQHVVPGRKSLLACALLALLAGNQAMADTFTNVGGTPIDVNDVNAIFIDDADGVTPGVGNSIFIDAANATISVDDGVSGQNTTIGAAQSDFSGAVNVNSGTLSVTNGGSLSVDGNTSVTTLSATDVTADSVSATTIIGGTVTGSLNAAGAVVSNVGNGVADTDAVNVSQLNAMQGSSNNFANEIGARFNAVDRRIDSVEEVANAGVASVAALAAIPAPAYGKRFSVGAGLGNYSSESAVAVGFRAAITESTSITAGVSRNTASKTAANLGVGYSW
jgi:autotransporter adhesin